MLKASELHEEETIGGSSWQEGNGGPAEGSCRSGGSNETTLNPSIPKYLSVQKKIGLIFSVWFPGERNLQLEPFGQ